MFHLEFNRESVKITETDNKKTLKADHLVLNWYKSTGTLQFQGSEAARYKAYLNQLIEGSKDLRDANEPQAKCCHVDDTNDEQNINNVDRDQTTSPETTAQTTSPNENVSVSEFTREIGKIWSKIKAIDDRFNLFEQPGDEDEDANLQLSTEHRYRILQEANSRSVKPVDKVTVVIGDDDKACVRMENCKES